MIRDKPLGIGYDLGQSQFQSLCQPDHSRDRGNTFFLLDEADRLLIQSSHLGKEVDTQSSLFSVFPDSEADSTGERVDGVIRDWLSFKWHPKVIADLKSVRNRTIVRT